MKAVVPFSGQDVLNGTTVGQSTSWELSGADRAPEPNVTQSRPDGPGLQGRLEGNVSADTPRLQMNLTLVNAPSNDSTSKEVGQDNIRREDIEHLTAPTSEHHVELLESRLLLNQSGVIEINNLFCKRDLAKTAARCCKHRLLHLTETGR